MEALIKQKGMLLMLLAYLVYIYALEEALSVPFIYVVYGVVDIIFDVKLSQYVLYMAYCRNFFFI